MISVRPLQRSAPMIPVRHIWHVWNTLILLLNDSDGWCSSVTPSRLQVSRQRRTYQLDTRPDDIGAVQASQVAWRLMKQLVSLDDKLVFGRALRLTPNRLLKGVVLTARELPTMGFATSGTRFGMRCHSYLLHCRALRQCVRSFRRLAATVCMCRSYSGSFL